MDFLLVLCSVLHHCNFCLLGIFFWISCLGHLRGKQTTVITSRSKVFSRDLEWSFSVNFFFSFFNLLKKVISNTNMKVSRSFGKMYFLINLLSSDRQKSIRVATQTNLLSIHSWPGLGCCCRCHHLINFILFCEAEYVVLKVHKAMFQVAFMACALSNPS